MIPSIKNIITSIFLILSLTSTVLSQEKDLTSDVVTADKKIQELFEYYNNDEGLLYYQSSTDVLGNKTNKSIFLKRLEEKKNKLGKLIKSELLLSRRASPNLLFMFYQSTYENDTLTEFFCLSREKSSEKFSVSIDNIDLDRAMKNEGEKDESIKYAEQKIQLLRGFYNNYQFKEFYQNIDFGPEGKKPQDQFISMITNNRSKFGKYVNEELLFTRNKSNGIILTYLTQYEKYAIVEVFGIVKRSDQGSYMLRVFNSYF